jgi:hypothetical protein
MNGKIVIELRRTSPVPESGSALPDMAHVAYALKKHIELYREPAEGSGWRLIDAWEVSSISTVSRKPDSAVCAAPRDADLVIDDD